MIDKQLAAFRILVDSCALTEQQAYLKALTHDDERAWLTNTDALDLTTQHAHQLIQPKRMRALIWRQLRSGAPLAVSLAHEIRRLITHDRTWHALKRLESHPELVAQDTRLGILRCGLLGGIHRIRSARAQLEQMQDTLPEWESIYMDGRLHWMDDERPRARELLEQIEPDAAHLQAYWNRRVHLLLEMGELEQAEELARRALDRFPESIYSLFALSRVLEARDRPREAAEPLGKVIRLSPKCLYRPFIEHRLELLAGDTPEVQLHVETLQQRRDYCGPNTLSLIARFWGEEIQQEQIAKGIWDKGTSYKNMWQWARDNGYEARVFSGNPTLIKRLLDRGIPVITERSWARSGHYYIFIGYSDKLEEFWLRDPDSPIPVRYKYEDYDDLFRCQDAWCMVMLPPEKASALTDLTLPNTEERELADGIGDRLFLDDPAALLEELDALDLSALPNTRDLLLLSLTEQLGQKERLQEVGQRLCQNNETSGALMSRVLRSWTSHLPPAQCLELCTQLVQIEKHPETLSNYVELLLEVNDFSPAQRWASRILEHYPGEASSYLSMANLLLRLEAEEKAIEYLYIAEEVDDKDPFIQTSLGNALLTVGHFEKAAGFFEVALEQRPGWYWPLFSRANGMERAGLHQEAIQSYRSNIETTAWYMPNYRQLANLLEDQGDPINAEGVIQQGIDNSSLSASLRLDLAYLHQRQGRFEESRSTFQTLLEDSPDYTSARVGLAKQLMIDGQMEAAVPLLQQAIEEAPTFGFAVHLLSQCYDRLGRHEEEVALLWDWLRSHPLDSGFDLALAENLRILGREQEILDHFAQLVESGIEPAGFCCRLGTILQRYLRWDEALHWIQRAIEFSPEEAWGHSLLGDTYWETQHFDEAAASYRLALELRPGYLWAIRRMAEYHLRRYEEEAIEYGRRLVAYDSNELAFLLEIFESLGRDEEAYLFLTTEAELIREQDSVQVHCGIIQERLGNLEQARKHHETALFIAPHNAWAMGRLAEVLIRLQDLEWAERLYKEAIRISPDYVWIRQQYVTFLSARGRAEEAMEVAQEGFRRNPSEELLQHDLRRLYLTLNRVDEGIAFLQEVSKTAEEPADLWCHIAILLHEEDRYDECLEAVDQACALDPEAGWPHRIAGLTHLQRRDYDRAETAFRRCIEFYAQDKVSWRHLTDLHRDRGEFDQAMECVQQRLRFDPDDLQIQEDLFELCQRGGLWQEGETLFAELEEITRWKDHTWLWRGKLRNQINQRDAAREAFDRAIELNPTFQRGLYERAMLDPDNLEDLERVLELNPGQGETLSSYIQRLDPFNDAEKGFAALRQALASSPDEQETFWLVNTFAEQTGDPTAGLPLLESMLSVVREPHVLQCYIGSARLAAGHIEEAKAAFTSALSTHPDFYWAHSRLGDLHRQIDQDEEAIGCWEQAIAADPSYSWPYDALAQLYAERGDIDGQWRILRARLAVDPDNVNYQYELQELAIANERFEDFRGQLLELLPLSRAPHELLTRIAHVLLHADQLEEALETVDRAIEANPRAWWAQSKKGDLLQALQREAEALPFYEAAITLKPDDWHSVNAIFTIRCNRGQQDQAEEQMLQYCEHQPEDEQLFGTLVRHYRDSGPLRGAQALLELAERVPERQLRALMGAGELYNHGGQYHQAIEVYDDLKARFPTDEEPYLALMEMYHAQGQTALMLREALAALANATHEHAEVVEQAILAMRGGFSMARMARRDNFRSRIAACPDIESLALLVEGTRKNKRFQRYFGSNRDALGRKDTSEQPYAGSNQDPFGFAVLMAVDYLGDDPPAAEDTARTLLRLRPRSIYAQYLLAEALTRTGKHTEALEVLRQFLRQRCDRDVDRSQFLLALNFLHGGEPERAFATMEEMMQQIEAGAIYYRWGFCEICEELALHCAAQRNWSDAKLWLQRRKPVKSHSQPSFINFSVRLAWAALTGRSR